MKPNEQTFRPMRAALCLLLAFGLVALMTPIPGAGTARAFAEQEESGAPTPQDAPSPADPNEGPAAKPSVEPVGEPAAEPAAVPPTAPTDEPSASPMPNPVGEPEADIDADVDADVDADADATIDPSAKADAAAHDEPNVTGPGEWILGKVEDIAFDLASTVALKTLGKAADASGNENLIKVVNFVDHKAGGVEQECEDILAAIDDLSNQIENLENSIDAQFNALERREILNQIENQRSQIIQMNDSVYQPALLAYNEYVQASKDYSEAMGTSNEESRRQAVTTKEHALTAAFSELNYHSSLSIIEANGLNMGSYTNHRYLYNLDQYADQALAFDHQRFALITAGINDVVTNLSVIAYVQRLEYDYWSAKAQASPDDQALQQKALDLENGLKSNLKRILQDVNYAVSEFANKDNLKNWPRTDLLSLARPYDFETAYEFDYEDSSSRIIYSRDGFLDFFHDTYPIRYTAQKKKTAPTMEVYRAVVKGTPYLVLNGDVGLSFGQKQGDVAHGVRYWEKIHRLANSHYYGFPDQDLFNLLSTKDGLYRLPTTFTPLAPIVQQTSYASSNGSLAGYFHANGMDTIGRESYVLMNSYDDPIRTTGALQQNYYTNFHVYSTAISVNGNYSAAAKNLYGEDTTPDYGMLAVLAPVQGEREAYPLHILTEGSGLAIAATDVDGNPLPERVPAGTRITLSVSADDAVALDSLVLRNAEGEVLQTFASSDTSSLISGGAGSISQATFTLTMPYQEVSLVGTPGKAEPNPLGFAEDADGAYLVSTLDDLVKVASAYEHHAGVYRHATFRLANDIDNVRYPFPAWKTPIGSEASPFTGTFDGAGHGIGGFSMDMATNLKDTTYGGLFGVVGSGGTVRNVTLYGTEFSGDPSKQIIGGLAGANHGTVQNCSTGSAQTGFDPAPGMLSPDDLRLTNATVSAKSAGGLVGENYGDIVNCWSGATVQASEADGRAGGLVGFSDTDSTVWNSYALGDVLGGTNAGGLIGRNYADVNISYYAGTSVEGLTKGSFIGANHHNVYNVYAAEDVAGGSLFGTGWAGEGGSATAMSRSSMTSQAFADTLNDQVTGAMDYWAQRADTHHGLPYLVSNPMIERTIVDEATGVQLSGIIHAGAVFSIEPVAEGDESRSELLQHAKEAGLLGELAASYRAHLPVGGLKSQQAALDGPVALHVPVPAAFAGRDVTVLQEHPDGMVALDAAIADGVATVQVDAVAPFAVIVDDAKGAPVSKQDASSGGSKLAPTGDSAIGWAGMLGALLAVAAGAGTLSLRRLRNNPKRK